MLKANSERTRSAPYYATMAKKMIAEHKAQQKVSQYQNVRPGEIMWSDEEEDEMEIIFIPDDKPH